MSDIKSFKFKRKKGGNSTLIFSGGKRVHVNGNDHEKNTVTIPASERTLLDKLDPKKNKLSVFELIGPGDVDEVGPKKEAEQALEALTTEPPLERAAGTEMKIVNTGNGWFDVYDAEGKKLTTKKLREDEAREMAGLSPKTEADEAPGNTEANTTDV
jgi:hypothetical protein